MWKVGLWYKKLRCFLVSRWLQSCCHPPDPRYSGRQWHRHGYHGSRPSSYIPACTNAGIHPASITAAAAAAAPAAADPAAMASELVASWWSELVLELAASELRVEAALTEPKTQPWRKTLRN